MDTLEDQGNGITEVIYGGSAGSGKSYLGCYWVLKNCIKYAGTRWLIGRTVLKTLKQTTLQTFFEVCKAQGLQSDVHYNYKEQAGEIHFFNGSVVYLADLDWYPSDPEYDRLGGQEISGAFVDEIAQMRAKAWDVVRSRIRYKLLEYDLTPKIFGSLNPSKNWVYTRFYKPSTEGKLDRNKAFIQALPVDNPNLPKSYIQVLKSLPKSERDRLLLGKWEASDDNQLIKQEAIDNLTSNEWVIDEKSQHYITADIARMGKDNSVIYVWRGLEIIQIVKLSKTKLTETADVIKTLKQKYKVLNSNVIVDVDGVGAGVADILRAEEFHNNATPINKENYQNLKTQCYYKLSEYINENKIRIGVKLSDDEMDLIREELEQIQSAPMIDDKKLAIISKDIIKGNIGRSPDYSDAMMMRIYLEIKPKLSKLRIG